eukprot:6207383-Pleurochrysis_carterae.AAC.3
MSGCVELTGKYERVGTRVKGGPSHSLRQGVRACLRSLRAQRCAAPMRSPQHAGLQNSSPAIL